MKPHCHHSHYRSEAGFSLIELMVVLVIIGLMTSAAVVLAPQQAPPLLNSAQRTSATLNALMRQSVMSGDFYAVDLSGGAFDIRRRTLDGWVNAQAISANNNAFINAFISAAQVKINTTAFSAPKKNEVFQPTLWFLPTGEFPAFELSAITDDGIVSITGTPGKPIKVTYNDR